QMCSLNNIEESLDFFNNIRIIDELCNLHEEVTLKGNYDQELLKSIEQYLTNNKLKPKDLIN
ncbi:2718_t:CDS:1, partial [Scutellospora calospora]